MNELERRMAELIIRIREGEPRAFEEFGELIASLSTFYLLGAGVGLHGSSAAGYAASWVTAIVAAAHGATPPYRDWVAHEFEALVSRDFFQDAAALQATVFGSLQPLPAGVIGHVIVRPRQRVSGDFVLIEQSEHEVWLTVADVTGHGTAAAVYGALALRLVHMARLEASVRGETERLSTAVLAVNRRIMRTKIGTTALPAIFVRLNTDSRIVEILNCGSVAPPVHLRNGTATALASGSPPLGYLDNPDVEIWRDSWHPGDTLVLPTDGLVEQPNPDGIMFSRERLLDVLERLTSHQPKQIAEQLIAAVDTFAAGTPQSDDQTVLVIRLVE